MRLIISGVMAALTFGGWANSGLAQDPAIVNAKTIKVKFENDRVRVLASSLRDLCFGRR
jgi:hypothetical protein